MIRTVEPVPITLQEALQTRAWRTFDRAQLTSFRESVNLPEYLFVELLLDWMQHTTPSNNDILAIWNTLDFANISVAQLKYIRDFVKFAYHMEIWSPLRTTQHRTAVAYKCRGELVTQLKAGNFATFFFPLGETTTSGLEPSLSFRLRLRSERDPGTGASYETESIGGDGSEYEVVHWFIVCQESWGPGSLGRLFERFSGGPRYVFVSLFVNGFEDICAVLEAFSRNIVVYALLRKSESA